MDNSVQKITENTTLIASDDTWIEGLAIQQLIKTSELAGMHSVAGMPDLHPGRGYPIGAAFFTTDKIYPALVGNDIGCGMSLWQTSVKVSKVNLDKLVKKFAHIEQPLDASWSNLIEVRKAEKNIANHYFDHALGTIGGGNHFAEFQAIDEIYDHSALDELGINKKHLQLLVHSGSRGLGQSILVKHIEQHNHDGLHLNTPDFHAYITAHNEALRWAELNRELIALRFLAAVRATGQCTLDINHNLVTAKCIADTTGWLHRKGATPSDKGYVVIPGSRGDYSYLVKPVTESAEHVRLSLHSLAHGAGRKWKRGECQGRLSHKYKREDLYRTALGSRVICGNKELLYDEAPQAYKKCETIISDLTDAKLVEVIARLRPVLTFKTNGSCSA
ncbi:release factor H-coupled RctB family protein [Pseudoalteromonas luteoviolacea CPMOR-2]|uniref:3'-phosphate/5'-hydroxy nucleic acid ligase n=1 Tax=Pseudoalteromonas luteoviolacea DSM 6061 TaxID=1365250 RepID=A0A166UI81_9GAMM|nr:RNA ligase RtcB family protein [Pseudoalteromonas luteoviolacea]KZN30701.1 release factor H-coupled RctB family protein [Pseudoalteromonas luteoviolacea DSM 6061]KZN56226.1 release factor H-coupled RctB family protein [Pseudoalteromonas luteoviolacea CPMOR-2]MBE0388442.1 release factor H-coupled RctB family protein [Pseudoalteromonas luteoviolacea DSM 6061]